MGRIVVAILGAVGSSALALVAVTGALVFGGRWVVRGLFSGRDRSAWASAAPGQRGGHELAQLGPASSRSTSWFMSPRA